MRSGGFADSAGFECCRSALQDLRIALVLALVLPLVLTADSAGFEGYWSALAGLVTSWGFRGDILEDLQTAQVAGLHCWQDLRGCSHQQKEAGLT